MDLVTIPARNSNQTRRATSRRDVLSTSCADGSGIPLPLTARRAQIRTHILPLT